MEPAEDSGNVRSYLHQGTYQFAEQRIKIGIV